MKASEEKRPISPEIIEWAIAQYHRPKMLQVEVSRRFFYAAKANPDKVKLIAVDENGNEVIERPHRKRMPGEDELGTQGYDTFSVLRKE
jgi:hypothetical protein